MKREKGKETSERGGRGKRGKESREMWRGVAGDKGLSLGRDRFGTQENDGL